MAPEYIPVPNVELSSGGKIPLVGLGLVADPPTRECDESTWQSKPGQVTQAVKTALEAGYRHIDGAFVYRNEKEVGAGIRASGVPREEIFVTSKLWCTKHRDVGAALNESLELLGLEYLDLYLIHWPVPLNPRGNDPMFPKNVDGSRDLDKDWSIARTWEQMEQVQEKGLTKAIGISNFSEAFIDDLLKTAKIPPAANQASPSLPIAAGAQTLTVNCPQIELHPYLPQHELVEYLRSKNIVAQAYSPLGSTDSPLLDDDDIKKIADKHGVPVGTILISWSGALFFPRFSSPPSWTGSDSFVRPVASPLQIETVERRVVVLPKSVTEHRIVDNLKLVKLDRDDM
ncbi:hypothetical protein JCM11491_001993, partial [Sporobolomyces phaffii]